MAAPKQFDITDKVRSKTGDATGDAVEQARVANLIEVVRRTVAPDSWDWVGGTGALRAHFLPPVVKWYLVVQQPQTILDEIDTLLKALK